MANGLVRFRDSLSVRARWLLLAAFTVVLLAWTALAPRIAQPESYHHFADARGMWGVPNALNVLSNVPFLVVGVWALWWMSRPASARHFSDRLERWPAFAIFFGLLTTGLGSAYYHLHPNNHTLVFDRLGMIVGFMPIVPLAIAERVNARWGAWLLAPMIALGAGTVLYWSHSETAGAGDLRWYFLAQGYAFVATAGILLFTRPRYDRQWLWLAAIGCYGMAKVAELLDGQIYGMTRGLVSGHSTKHVVAAVGAYFLLRMFQTRRAVTPGLAEMSFRSAAVGPL